MESLKQNIETVIDWAISTYGYELAFKKAEENFSELVLSHLNYIIALEDKIKSDKFLSDRIANEMFNSYKEQRNPNFK